MNTQPWGAARWPHRPLHEECSAPASSRLYKLTLGQNEKCKEDPHNSAVEQTVLTTQTGLQEARRQRIQTQVLETPADAAKASVLTNRCPYQEYRLLKW